MISLNAIYGKYGCSSRFVRAKEREWPKERIRAEVEDWIARSRHEAVLAFEAGDLAAAAVWGAKIPFLRGLLIRCSKVPFEVGPEVDDVGAELIEVIEALDPGGRIRDAFGIPRPWCSADAMKVILDIHERAAREVAGTMGLPLVCNWEEFR